MQESSSDGGLRLSGRCKVAKAGSPLVSILTVVLNRNESIRRCIDSVADQTYASIEHVVVDGGSTDGTLETLREYGDRLDYFVSKADSGIYDAINKGLSLLSGDYFLILNSDDWYEPTAVEELVKEALRSNVNVVHADAWLVNRFGIVYGRLNGWLDDRLFTHRMPLRHETMLVARCVHERFGAYDINYQIIADYEFLVRIYQGGCTFSHVRKPLLYFSMDGISNRRRDLVEDERRRFYAAQFPCLDASDLNSISKGLSTGDRRYLIEKHAGKSELLIRSLASFTSIKTSAIARKLNSLESTPGKSIVVIARWIRRLPYLFFGNIARIQTLARSVRRR